LWRLCAFPLIRGKWMLLVYWLVGCLYFCPWMDELGNCCCWLVNRSFLGLHSSLYLFEGIRRELSMEGDEARGASGWKPCGSTSTRPAAAADRFLRDCEGGGEGGEEEEGTNPFIHLCW
jgi:hypothetical protein